MRESPAGSGESDTGDWREVIPGGDDEDKAVETNGNTLDMTLRDTHDEGEIEKQKCVGEQFHSPYEEELDPRIQVGALNADVYSVFGLLTSDRFCVISQDVITVNAP